MAEGGYYFKWRSFWDDIPKNHIYAKHEAWEWLFAWAEFNGDKTGKHETHLSTLATSWNWTRTNRGKAEPNTIKVRRFLDECVKKDRITYCATSDSHLIVKGRLGVSITITNYLKLQLREKEMIETCATSDSHLIVSAPNLIDNSSCYERLNKKQELINTKNKRGSMRGRAAPPLVSKKKILLDRAAIKNILDELALNLDSFKEIYGHYNVVDTWAWFYEACLNGTAKKPGVNPYKYSNFKAAFSNWLKKAYPHMISGEGGDE